METALQQFRRVVPREHRRAVAAFLRRGIPLPNALCLAIALPAIIAAMAQEPTKTVND